MQYYYKCYSQSEQQVFLHLICCYFIFFFSFFCQGMMLLLGKHQFLISSIDDLGGNSDHGNSNSTSNDQRGEKNKSQKTSSNLVIPLLLQCYFFIFLLKFLHYSHGIFLFISFGWFDQLLKLNFLLKSHYFLRILMSRRQCTYMSQSRTAMTTLFIFLSAPLLLLLQKNIDFYSFFFYNIISFSWVET